MRIFKLAGGQGSIRTFIGLVPLGVTIAALGMGACGNGKTNTTGSTAGLRIVSRPVHHAQTGERLKYKAVTSKAGAATWSMDSAPAGATIDEGGSVTWMPSASQGGDQSFSISATMGGETATQTFRVINAVTVMQTNSVVDPGNPNGATMSVDAPLSMAHGAAVQVEPGSLPPGPPLTMSISSVEHAPVPNTGMAGVIPQDLRPIEFGPTGLTFKKPVRIQVPITASVLAKGNPVVQTYDYETGTWRKLKPLAVDREHGIVTAETQHFSTYVAVPDVKIVDLRVGLGGAGTSCAGNLMVRAPLAVSFTQIPASSVNGYSGTAGTLAEILRGLPPGQALQVLIRVTARSQSGGDQQSGWVLGSATRLPDGRVKVSVTTGGHVGPFLAIPPGLADTDPDLEAWLNGSRVDFVFSALGQVAGGAIATAEASLYVLPAVDADRPPPASANAIGHEEVIELSPATMPDYDDDCDGAPNQWDPQPNGNPPPAVVGLPGGPIHVAVGGSVGLKAYAPGAGVMFTWGSSDPSVSVGGVVGGATASGAGTTATVTPSLPGQFQIWVTGTAGAASARFVWDIVSDPASVQAANTPPFVAIAAGASLVRAGEPVRLTAITKDAEQAVVTSAWSASDPATLATVAGQNAVFVATTPGDYVITCISHDGIVASAPAHITITVVSATANRPPGVPRVSPMSPAVEHAPGAAVSIDLIAEARDPDGDPLTYEFVSDAANPLTFTLMQDGPRASFATTQNGLYVFFATATDSHGARGPWVPVKIQVLSTLPANPTDGDKDRYPSGYDCDDNDPTIFPGAKEICGDGIDQNCDGRDLNANECDLDGDRFSPMKGDCDDGNPAIGPAASERCDGIDNNCNKVVDEGFQVGGACSGGIGACQAGGVTVCNAAWSGVTCGAAAGAPVMEICDGLDNDCNGRVDDVGTATAAASTAGDVANCGGCGITCSTGSNTVAACLGGGCVSSCAPDFVDRDRDPGNGCECRLTNGGREVCDGLDNDCNGVVDDGGGATYYNGPAGSMGQGACTVGVQICKDGQLVVDQPARVPSPEFCDGLDNDCNGKVDDGFDLASDSRNCGGCGFVCPAGVACQMGKCGDGGPTPTDGGVGPADGGVTPTDGRPIVGDGGPGGMMGSFGICNGATGAYCADFMYDRANCGMCGRACLAVEHCMGGTCVSAAAGCSAPKMMCSDPMDPAKQYCTDPLFDPRNCGSCGKFCPAGVPCQMGVCQGTAPITTCPAAAPIACPTATGGMTCSDPKSDPSNCGGCGRPCPAGVPCQMGVCGSQTCPATSPNPCPTPMGDVCVNFASDSYHCGRCGLVCPAGLACQNGMCGGAGGTMCPASAPTVCPGPQGPLCTNLSFDATNCGNCGIICPAGLMCQMAMCGAPGSGADGGTTAMPMCPPGAPSTCLKADGTAQCTDLMRDPGNCGMCGRGCPAGTTCTDGVCMMGSGMCAPPLSMCANGCTSLKDDPQNCGACGNSCGGAMGCQNGTCGGTVMCPAAMLMCVDAAGGRTYCADPMRDSANCGGCGRPCPANAICTAGVCQGGGGTFQGLAVCPGPGGAPMCTNLIGDPANCGACGNVCTGSMGCFGGTCGSGPTAITCPPELKPCSDPTGKMYCANSMFDPGNCGACGRVCPAGLACMNGGCVPFVPPDGGAPPPPDGGVPPAGDGGATADAGVPPITCPVGFVACPNAAGVWGCTDFNSDNANCGACGKFCPAGTTCQQKVCL